MYIAPGNGKGIRLNDEVNAIRESMQYIFAALTIMQLNNSDFKSGKNRKVY